jgi:hypothetical protein
MSDGEKHILNIVRQVLNEELKSIVAILQANQPTESSRMARLVTDIVVKEVKPIMDHLNTQDIEIGEIKKNLTKLTDDTSPLVEGKNTATSIFKFALWSAPIALIYGALKWSKLIP